MCDYSLEHIASRSAKVGDKLVTTCFRGFTVGFCAVGQPDVAVCLKPGTELAFDGEVQIPSGFWMRSKKLGAKVARFRRVNEGSRTVHHDALELPDGQTVLLTRLREGQLATVVQLPPEGRQYETENTVVNLTAVSLTPR